MLSDQDIIIQFKEVSLKEAAFTELVKRHQKKVYYQIKRMVQEHADADDIAQSVWIKVWEKLDGFKMESEFTTWLFRIAYNETLNFIAKNARRGISSNEAGDDSEQGNYTNENGPTEAHIQIKLEQAISQLPEKQKFVFLLRYYEEFDYEKIASITGTSVGGAKANYHQAIKKMQEFVKAD
jgi:RNA polymerase sigma-70 factor (ECF subfamily)